MPSIPNLKRVREAKFLTQEALAKRSGVSRPTIARLEGGENEEARFSTIHKLAQALGVKPEQLVRDSEKREVKRAA